MVGETLVNAADTVTVQFVNVASMPVNAPSEVYTVVYIKNTAV